MTSMSCRCSAAARAAILDAARAAGACAAGFTDAAGPSADDTAMFARWLALNHNAGMAYMGANGEARRNPQLVLEGARSMLCAAFSYAADSDDDRSPLIADYARGLDYHTVLRRRLAPVAAAMEAAVPGSRTRICTDSAPVRERYRAVRAGLGRCGVNGLLAVPGAGNAVFLAEILWTADVEPSSPLPYNPCTECRRCVDACPGGAIVGDGTVDARRCLSYLTIEHAGALPDGLTLPGRIYGCDICSRVCPLAEPHAPALPEFTLRPELRTLRRDDLTALGSSAYRRLTAGSAMRRVPASRLARNASTPAVPVAPTAPTSETDT